MPLKFTREKIVWAAGLFEGEGCISPYKQLSKNGRQCWTLAVKMTDEDAIKRFHSCVEDLGSVVWYHSPSVKAAGRKPLWTWRCTKRAHVYSILAAIYPFLCERRKARALEALNELPPVNEMGGKANISLREIQEIQKMHENGTSMRELGRIYGRNTKTISKVVKGQHRLCR